MARRRLIPDNWDPTEQEIDGFLATFQSRRKTRKKLTRADARQGLLSFMEYFRIVEESQYENLCRKIDGHEAYKRQIWQDFEKNMLGALGSLKSNIGYYCCVVTSDG